VRDDPEPWFGRDETDQDPDPSARDRTSFDRTWQLESAGETPWEQDTRRDRDHGDDNDDVVDNERLHEYTAETPPDGWWTVWRRRLLIGGGVTAALIAAVLVIGWWLGEAPLPTDGEVPLIKAEGTPVKVRPTDRGGIEVPHQDRLIFERLDGGSEQPKVERLLPPPEDPLPKPLAMPDLPQPVTPVEPPAVAELPPKPPLAHLVDGTGAGDLEDLGDRGRRNTVVTVRRPTAEGSAAPGVESARSGGSTGGSDAEIARGADHFVQVGALRSLDAANTEWRRLQRLHPDLLDALGSTFRRADLGERGIFYRVLGGPLTADRAAETCTALKQRGIGCYVIEP